MTIRDLRDAIQEAMDFHGVPEDAEVKIGTDGYGTPTIRAEFGCGFFRLMPLPL